MHRPLALSTLLTLAACGGGGGAVGSDLATPLADFAWQQRGFEGGFVPAVVYDPHRLGTVWASGDDGSGLFRSNDGGLSWSRVAEVPFDHATYSLVVHPNDPTRIYAPNYFGRGLLRSVDGGSTWAVDGAGLPTDPPTRLAALGVDPADDARLVACTAAGLFLSTDFGDSFAPLASATFGAEGDFTAFAASSAGWFVGTAGGAVFRSTNAGLDWSTVIAPSGLEITALALSDHALYIGTAGGTLLRTTDFALSGLTTLNLGGGSGVIDSGLWSRLAVVSGATAVEDLVYVGTVATATGDAWGFFASDDGGATFERRMSGMGEEGSVFSIAVNPLDPSQVLVGTSGGGLFRTLNGGLDWVAASAGVQAGATLGFAQAANDAQHLVVSSTEGLNRSPGLFESVDGGDSWSAVTLEQDALSIHLLEGDSDLWLVGGFNGDGLVNPGILRSAGGAAGPFEVRLATRVRVERFVEAAGRVYACAVGFSAPAGPADLGLWASSDDGLTWSLVLNGLVNNVAMHSAHGTAVAVGEDAWTTSDHFASAPTSLGLASALAAGESGIGATFLGPTELLVGTSQGRLLLGTDYDAAAATVVWTPVTTPARDVFIRDVQAFEDAWYLACFTGDFFGSVDSTPGLLRSTDRGATWEFLESGLEASRLVWSLSADTQVPGRFWAGMWGGGLMRLTDL
ncbi:MAG: hypothetical protein AAFZ65_01385 [Planctomycetota bacterium]